jgi:hypothetical protein
LHAAAQAAGASKPTEDAESDASEKGTSKEAEKDEDVVDADFEVVDEDKK